MVDAWPVPLVVRLVVPKVKFEPVELSETEALLMGLLNASRARTVSVAAEPPALAVIDPTDELHAGLRRAQGSGVDRERARLCDCHAVDAS